jgi:archaetidylinositol phosphate synthase
MSYPPESRQSRRERTPSPATMMRRGWAIGGMAMGGGLRYFTCMTTENESVESHLFGEPMAQTNQTSLAANAPWDARIARRLVAPLVHTRVTPNHLTTVRLAVGLAAAAAFLSPDYAWAICGALLMALSNLLDHADGELARITGKTSRFGHFYDLASDAAVTILVFFAIGVGRTVPSNLPLAFPALGAIAGIAIALIFYVRMRIEGMAGKSATRQAALAGFETEDVLYLVPLVTLCHGLALMLVAAAICAPLYALWTVVEFGLLVRRRAAVPPREVAR